MLVLLVVVVRAAPLTTVTVSAPRTSYGQVWLVVAFRQCVCAVVLPKSGLRYSSWPGCDAAVATSFYWYRYAPQHGCLVELGSP